MTAVSSRKATSLSKAVKMRSGGSFSKPTKTAVKRIAGAAARHTEALKLRLEQITGLSFEDRDALERMDVDPLDEEDAPLNLPLPPGEESLFFSHAGGEEELCHEIFSEGDSGKRIDARTRRDRTLVRTQEWEAQREQLVDAYLAWMSGARPSLGTTDPWSIHCVDFFDCGPQQFFPRSESSLINVTLALQDYMGTAPVRPSVAIGFKALEAYRQLHRVCPRLSIQAQVRTLCYLQMVPVTTTLVNQFSIAFDMYLDILHHVDKRVNVPLRRNVASYRMLNACAPCLYKLQDEQQLSPALLVTMDGNQSLKLVDNQYRSGEALADTRTARTDLWISPAEVDRFKDEVQHAAEAAVTTELPPASSYVPSPGPSLAPGPSSALGPSAPGPSLAESAPGPFDDDAHSLPIDIAIDNEDNDNDWFDIDDPAPDDPTTVCVKRWRNAGPESRKKMFALFDITGVFVSLCRHGQCLAMCDMIRSGELMKYPLAIVNKLVDTYGGDIKIGYDIACAFSKVLRKSSIGAKVTALGVTGVVPAFHGHSHNRPCQAIEQFFGFWSEQKHAESGKFILDNYRQALTIIKDDTVVLDLLCKQLSIGHSDFERYLSDERKYYKSRRTEPPEIAMELDYVEALHRLKAAGFEAIAARDAADKLDVFIPVNMTNPRAAKTKHREINAVRTKARTAQARWETVQLEVLRREEQLEIVSRWQPGEPKYEEMARELKHRRYRQALDRLESLVVQRLFELTKLQLSGTGYKLREKIGKALKARAEAIRKALTEYNARAAELSPPRDALSWNDILDMSTLADFDLLRDTRQDIRSLPWAKPTHRRAMNLYFNIKRAREEIVRLDIEISRLFTYMVDEHYHYYDAIATSLLTDIPLAHELSRRWQYRQVTNSRIVQHLLQAMKLDGFTGKLEAGFRQGSARTRHSYIPLPSWARLESTPTMHTDLSDTATSIPGAVTEREEEVFVDFVDSLGEVDVGGLGEGLHADSSGVVPS
ncbi:hypothetical protein ONZ51_g12302 [Trametes cubensis]|uniref:CxC1-like cysteine cluster associated with KDZ transposases domain-containing protein n=1 Tax=Trametes cubensis TaxID=1111947 RepID=A0AAD7X5J0_9APHY|nr:hypothetical protein ONZ51_g12302 [Trametes cubensis]